MELLALIKARRSIRRFQSKEIPQDDLQHILEAVQWAPSWANTQCWEIIVVQKPELKQQLRETLGKGNPAAKGMVEAPLVLVLCARLKTSGYYKGEVTTKFGDWFMYDLGIATQNLCLMAHSVGLGTVVVGLFDHDKAASLLDVPAGYEVVTMIPLGYPAAESKAPKRREISDFVHHERF
ncbi:MAG: nitroreductase family protein [Deltaproteobacteria bacterium]|nr:nitroreductase family protein [Deltaproteobacteria bacterium]MBW2069655.1 nitroreductase family protein [Deltaproteobacteria bacterium]